MGYDCLRVRVLLVLLALSLFLASGCSYDDAELDRNQALKADLQHMVDSIWNAYLVKEPAYPGGVALKVLHGPDAFYVSSGLEDIQGGGVHFRAASCTKTLTATAILLLQEQGRLNINHKINDLIPGTQDPYVPDIPAYNIPFKESITILDLLRHRAGVYDVANETIPDTIAAQLPYKGMNYIDYVLESDESFTISFDHLVQVVSETGLFYFPPGTAYHYSNTGYSILGKIIERVSGQSFRNFLTDHVLRPMGMFSSSLPDLGSDQFMPDPWVPGYVLFDDEIYDVTQSNMSAYVAEGNLITTADDLALFLHKLLSGKGILGFNTVNSIMMNYLPAGTTRAGGYGCGLTYTNNLGYGHSGAHAGYLTIMAYDPAMDFTVVVYTNAWNLSDGMNSLVYQLNHFLESICYSGKALVKKHRRNQMALKGTF